MAFRKRKPPAGARPGTLAIASDAPAPRIQLIRYGEKLYEGAVPAVARLGRQLRPDCIAWVDVQGLGDEPTLWALAKRFHIHPLAMEDAVNTPQRPKTEAYEDHQLFVIRMVQISDQLELDVEQVTLLLSQQSVLTFQERYGDVLDPVRRRLREGQGIIRRAGADYLAYAIIDTIVDGYFPVIEALGEGLEELESEIMARPSTKHLQRINDIKGTLLRLRRSLWPLREMLNSIVRDPGRFVGDETRLYFRDTYDHAVQLVEVLESHREIASGLMNTYLSVVSNRTNEVMKTLTITATIFIPLTFIAGIYGMNFEGMPELRWKWSYPAFWAAMVMITLGLIVYFRRKGWLGEGERGGGGGSR